MSQSLVKAILARKIITVSEFMQKQVAVRVNKKRVSELVKSSDLEI